MIMMHGLKVEEQQDAFELLQHKIETYFNTEQQQAHILDDQEMIPWLQSVPMSTIAIVTMSTYVRKSNCLIKSSVLCSLLIEKR